MTKAQMSNLCLQEQQRTPELIPKFLDFLDVFLVNLVRDIGTVGDLVDIVRNVIGDTVYLFQLIFVDLNDVSLKGLKLSITLDTLTARILKLSSDSQSRIEPTPFYSWWEPTDCRADSAVTPVAHKISPDHRF